MSAAIDDRKVEYVVLGKVFYAANVVHFCKIEREKAPLAAYFFFFRKKCDPHPMPFVIACKQLHFFDKQVLMLWVYTVVKKRWTCKLADEDSAQKC